MSPKATSAEGRGERTTEQYSQRRQVLVRVPQEEVGTRSSITFVGGITFSNALFARLLLRQGDLPLSW